MKKNFIERHLIWISMLVFCFMIVPNIRASFAMEEESAAVIKLQNTPSEQSRKKVVLDPGHGGFDGGGESNSGIKEKDVTLKLAKRIGALLEKQGYDVMYTRDQDNIPWGGNSINDVDEVNDLNKRSSIANDSKADCFVSIHTNYSEILQDEITGNEIWVKAEDERSLALAKDINKKFIEMEQVENRGVKDQAMSPLQLLVANNIPSVLIETGFLSNEKESKYLNSDEGIKSYANAIANGIIEYLK